jgi:hypothetical protein
LERTPTTCEICPSLLPSFQFSMFQVGFLSRLRLVTSQGVSISFSIKFQGVR